jgi:hypothetical protein
VCGRLLFFPWLYVRVLLYILVSSARSAEKLVYELAQNTVLHLCGASKSYAEMWEKKLFLSLVVWLSWSILLASYDTALELGTG